MCFRFTGSCVLGQMKKVWRKQVGNNDLRLREDDCEKETGKIDMMANCDIF